MTNKISEVLKVLSFKASYSLDYPLVSPDTLQISLTSRCNLRCRMCSVNKYLTKPEDEMSFDEVCKIISKAKEQFGIQRLVITGGEPLLLVDLIVQISTFARKLGIGVILTTNGFYIERNINELVDSGITHFHISIDGLEGTHNYIRQNDASYESAIKGIKLLVDLRNRYDYKYSIGLATLILKPNIPELYDLFAKADALGVDFFDLLPYLPDNTEFSDTTGTSLWPDEKAVQTFLQVYERIIGAKADHIRINDFVNADLIAKYYLRKMNKFDWQCMAGFKNIFITMSDPKRRGRLEPCVFMCKMHMPIREQNYDFKKIWFSAQARTARRDIKRCEVYCYQPCFSFPTLSKLLKLK
jgi:MoaA/NifB/PqqE/SkfB family radical SAM enzyme